MRQKRVRIKGIFEHRLEKPLSDREFRIRLGKYFFGAASVIAVSLGAGMIGYRWTESLSWTDSFLNAAMILGGMGEISELKTEAGKLFAGCYALFAGLILIASVGLVLTPLIHRLLHKFHFEEGPDDGKSD